MANLQDSPQVFGALSSTANAPTKDYKTRDKELIDAVFSKYNLKKPTSIYDTSLDFKTASNQLANLDYNSVLAIMRNSSVGLGGEYNPIRPYAVPTDTYNKLLSIYSRGPAPGVEAYERPNVSFQEEFNLPNINDAILKLKESNPKLFEKYNNNTQEILKAYQTNPSSLGYANLFLGNFIGSTRQALPYMTYAQAQEVIKDPAAFSSYTGLTPEEVSAAANKILQAGPPPTTDLGEPYVSPILTGEQIPTGSTENPVFPESPAPTAPATGAPTQQSELEALFSPEQLQLIRATLSPQSSNDTLKQQQDLIAARIAEQTAQNVASAKGEAITRGLTGGSYEARRVSGAQSAGTKATAEQLTNLAIESAKQQRSEQVAREQQLSTQLFSQLQQETQMEFQAEQARLERQFSVFQDELQREYDSLEAYKNRAFEAGQQDKARYYQAQQAELDRAFQQKMAEYQAQVAAAQQRAAEKAARKNAVIGAIGGGLGSLATLPFMFSKTSTTKA